MLNLKKKVNKKNIYIVDHPSSSELCVLSNGIVGGMSLGSTGVDSFLWDTGSGTTGQRTRTWPSMQQ